MSDFTVAKQFVNEVREASLAVMKNQGIAVKFYQMYKAAKEKHKLTDYQFLHAFDPSIPSALDSRSDPPITVKSIGAIPAYNRLRYLLRVGSAGIKRTVTAEGRAEKTAAKARAWGSLIKSIAGMLKDPKQGRAIADKIMKLVDTSEKKRFTGDVLALAFGKVTASDITTAAKTESAKTA